MVGTSKILTVSYGTFSCTLEGFDDSFEMMKAISEYFRDLAADDRYFGAEPPKLDGEMLAQLAARRSAIAIAAEQSGDRVVLRPAPAPAPAAAAPQLQMPVPQPQQAAQPAPSAQPAAKAPADDNSIAARLQRIRSVVAGADTAAQDFSEDQHAEPFLTAAAFMATPATNAMPEQADLASLAADIAADIGEDEDTGEDTFNAIQAAARDAAEDSAEQPTEHTADDSTDTTIDDIAEDSPETTLHNTMAGFGAHIDAQPPTPPTPQHAEGIDAAGLLDRGAMSGAGPDAAATWTPASAMAAAGPENDHDEDMIEIETLDEDDTGNAQPAPDAEPRLRVMKMRRADFEAAVAAGRLEPMDEEDDEDGASLWAPEATAEGAEGGEVTSSLPAEDEADLRRELAEIEAELEGALASDPATKDANIDAADSAAEAEDNALFADLPPAAPAAQPRLSPASSDADMQRLLAKTDQEMGQPDTANRHQAIAHLRAAVAATRADIAAGGALRPEGSGAAYRADLADVVRPVPAQAPALRLGDAMMAPQSASATHAAPLLLVAEQRVDTQPAPQPASPSPAQTTLVRPRRVQVPAPAPLNPADGAAHAPDFVDFVDQSGAKGLAEILEAAAAYMADIEGQEAFTRPQLLAYARNALGHDFSREDGMRSLGTLLRQGRLRKAPNGRFAVSSQTSFRPRSARVG